MKVNQSFAILSIAIISTLSVSANADEWRFGAAVSIISGTSDVIDLYEDNLEQTGYYIDDEIQGPPIGAAFRAKYQDDSGMRVDLSLGPLFLIFGDADHIEMPLTGTIGYDFTPSANVSPFVRLGVAYHMANGDFVDGSSPGLLAAVGVEFNRLENMTWGIELSIDDSTVDIERYQSFALTGIEEVNTYDTQFSVYFLF